MSQEYEFDNISTQEFLDNCENLILQNPEMDGVEIEDSLDRTWFIILTSRHATIN